MMSSLATSRLQTTTLHAGNQIDEEQVLKNLEYKENVYDEIPEEGSDEEDDESDEEPEEIAKLEYEAFMMIQSARQKLNNAKKVRGFFAPGASKQKHGRHPRSERDPAHEAKFRELKVGSTCSGCGKKGHQHKDTECPLNS